MTVKASINSHVPLVGAVTRKERRRLAVPNDSLGKIIHSTFRTVAGDALTIIDNECGRRVPGSELPYQGGRRLYPTDLMFKTVS